MKCISCTHPVPTDLSFAFQSNQCPKCGLQLMEEEVKPLFIEMKNYIDQGNDLGDLAKFLYHKFGDIQFEGGGHQVGNDEPIFDPDLELLGPAAPKPKMKPVSQSRVKGEGPMLSPERLKHFNKQGNIDRMNSLVEEIQGKKENQELITISDLDEGDTGWTENAAPLSAEELAFAANEIYNLQETPDPSEMHHLSRLDRNRR